MASAAETSRYTPQFKQQIALSRSEDLLFYGGAKGGGKSDFLLIDYLAHASRYAAASRGVIFRRTYNELEELIHRSRQLYINAEFSETKKVWTFSSGATLKMRFVESDQDVSRYQGHQYSWIGMDELTEWPTDYCMIFLLSCLRSPDGVPCYFRASGNPGRIGHQWVKAYFIDVAAPMQPFERVIHLPDNRTASMWQIYIPASLDDNTALTKADPMYEARLALLPPYLYDAFRHGNWDVIAGAAFAELRRDIHGIDPANPPERLLRVFDFERMTPKADIKIFRSFDWGYAKPFSLGWYFSDYDGRLYRYRELYGCTSPNKGIEMPARDVAIKIRTIEQEHKERVSMSIADASIWDKPSNQNEMAEKLPSIAETMAEEGVWFDRDVSIDAKKSRLQGKHQLHERFRLDADSLPHLFVFNNCVHWWRTVPAIPIDRLNPEDVDTAAEDHCLTGDTKVITDKGSIAIKDLVGQSGQLLSRDGKMEPFTNCKLTSRNAHIVSVLFDDGREVVCTPDHQFLTADGFWCQAKNLTGLAIYDSISYLVSKGDKVCASKSLMRPRKSLKGRIIGYAGHIISAKVKGCIGLSMNHLTGKFRQVGTYITKMATDQITKLKTLNYSTRNRTCLYTVNRTINLNGLRVCTEGPQNGMEARQVSNFTKSITSSTVGRLYLKKLKCYANTVMQFSMAKSTIPNSVLTNASLHGEESREKTTLPLFVRYAASHAQLINMLPENTVRSIVERGPARNPKVVSVTPAGRSDVYCLDVPTTHAFAINGGIVVHNCYDETRYLASARPMSSRIQQPEAKPYSVNWFYKRNEQPEGVYI